MQIGKTGGVLTYNGKRVNVTRDDELYLYSGDGAPALNQQMNALDLYSNAERKGGYSVSIKEIDGYPMLKKLFDGAMQGVCPAV